MNMLSLTELKLAKDYWEQYAKSNNIRNSRSQSDMFPRAAFMSIMVQYSHLTLSQIAGILGMNHATVIHHSKKHKFNLRIPFYKDVFLGMKENLGEPLRALSDERLERHLNIEDEAISKDEYVKFLVRQIEVKQQEMEEMTDYYKFREKGMSKSLTELTEQNVNLRAELARVKNLV